MDYTRISADCHIDLCWLPHDLFVTGASAALRIRRMRGLSIHEAWRTVGKHSDDVKAEMGHFLASLSSRSGIERIAERTSTVRW